MNYIIITGASKGVGECIAEQLLEKNNHLFCISRGNNDKLVKEAQKKGIELEYFNLDLNKVDEIQELMESMVKKVNKYSVEGIYLVNNAGVVNPIKKIDGLNSEEVSQNLNVNLIAPMMATSAFIRCTKEFKVEKRIINISSGAGKAPIYGWSAYCAAKAGLDLFSRCAALEQDKEEFPVKTISFGPGIVDTNLQVEIRSADKENFVDLEKFISYKEEGQLRKPEDVASVVVKLLFSDEFENGKITNVGEYI